MASSEQRVAIRAPEGDISRPQSRNLHILYVDEPDATADQVTALLHDLEFVQPIVAREHSVGGARDAITAASPDLVIADFWLGDGNSLTLAEDIVRRMGVPVVVLSSLEDEEISSLCGDTGALVIHSKANLSATALHDTIRAALLSTVS